MSEPASSEDEDFSASSEDWNPKKDDSESTEESDESDEELFVERKLSYVSKKLPKSNDTHNKVQSSTKNDNNSSDILPKINNSLIKSKSKDGNNSDSDSSVDDYLVHPESLNFKSEFFNTPETEITSFDKIEQSIMGEVKDFDELDSSDSDNDEQFEEISIPKHDKSEEENPEEEKVAKLNFKQIHDFAKNLENVKTTMQNYSHKQENDDHNMNIDDLLALGEKKEVKEDTKVVHSDSDEFEEVKASHGKREKKVPKEGITITINLPNSCKSSKSKEDYRMKMKRKMNNIMKQNQVYVHKVHVLCWIAHGNYVNRILNYPKLLKGVLGLIPSNNCYPPKQSDLKYLEMILKWYIVKMKFSNLSKKKDQNITSIAKLNLDKNLTLVQSLSVQIKAGTACSKKSLILIFIVLMRALGLQCRLVLSFVTAPLKPPASELYSLTTKSDAKNSGETKSTESSTKSEKKRGKSVIKNGKVRRNSTSTNKNEEKSIKSTGNSHGNKRIKIDKNDEVKSKNTKQKENVTSDKKLKTNKNGKSSDVISKNIKEDDTKEKIKKLESTPVKSQTQDLSPKNLVNTTPRFTPKSCHGSPCTSKREKSRTPEIVNLSQKSKSKILARKNLADFSPALTRNKAKLRLEALKNSAGLKISQLDGADDSKNKKLNLKKIKTIAIDKSAEKLASSTSKSTENKASSTKSNAKDKTKEIKTSHTKSCYRNTMISSKSRKRNKRKLHRDEESESEYFEPAIKQTKKLGEIDRRVLSTDDDTDSEKNKKTADIWVEIFLEAEEKWISVDVPNCKVHCVKELYNKATHPVTYIVAWNNDLSLKDITRRYVPKWNTVTRKLRVESNWWDATLKPWLAKKTLRDREEDEDLYRSQLDQPLPTSIQEFKNHPLYVLKRHILKFEAIYPPDAMTLGFIRGEPVFARDCVHTLHSREIWLKEAKVVKLGEKPYKIVKARPKYDKLTGSVINNLDLELFGSWQIEDYVPPTAENGIVPRNAYGNVELFKPSMIPKGTVHLQLPGLNKVARKLQIDCAPAVVGFEFHSGFTHPTFDGFIVCQEYQDTLIAAWYQEEEEAEKRAIDRIEKRVYGNWRRIIKGLFIREKLKARYNFNDSLDEMENSKQSDSKSAVKRKRQR